MASELVYYDDLITGKHIDKCVDKEKFKFGSIFWVPIIYHEQYREVWRPNNRSEDGTTATSFSRYPMGSDAFKHTQTLKNPPLESTEEFPVIRAKKRPCVYVKQHNPAATNPVCQIIPMYSINDDMGKKKNRYSDDFINEVRSLKYDNLLYLKIEKVNFLHSSVLRLENSQFIYRNYLEHSGLRLTDEVSGILWQHVTRFFTGAFEPESLYSAIIEENKQQQYESKTINSIV